MQTITNITKYLVSKFIATFVATLIASQLVGMSAFAQAKPSSMDMFGEVSLHSNYVDKGLTQSDKTISVITNLGYQLGPQGRIGLNAASVKYQNESANVKLGLFGEFKFVFTPNADLKIRNDLVRYFSEGVRNKIEVLIDQNFFGYHVLLHREDNFEGTKRPRNWFAFHKDWDYSPNIQFLTTVGYSMVEDYSNYIDTRIGATYISGKASFSLVNTYVSSSAQFGGRADTAYFVVINVKF